MKEDTATHNLEELLREEALRLMGERHDLKTFQDALSFVRAQIGESVRLER